MPLSRKRNLKSYYYDKYTGLFDRAGNFSVRCCARPHRFFLVGQFTCKPNQFKLKWILNENGIRIKKIKIDKTLPF